MNQLRNALKRDYSQIPNEMITDLSLSNGSLRVLLYLFTKPDNWNVYNKDIQKQLKISDKTLAKYWKELLASQWLRREKRPPTDGKFAGGYLYQIGSFSISEEVSEKEESYSLNNTKPIKQEETNKRNTYKEFISSLKIASSIKSKVTETKEGRELFKSIEDKEKLFKDYIAHQLNKKEFAKRITAYMLDYEFHTKKEKADWSNRGIDDKSSNEDWK